MEKDLTARSISNLMNASEIASALNISKALVYRLMKTGQIRTVRIASALRVRRNDLDKYIQENLRPLSF